MTTENPTKDRLCHPEDVDESEIEKQDVDCPLCHEDTYSDGWTIWCWSCDWREEAA